MGQVFHEGNAPRESGKAVGKQDREGRQASKGTLSGQGPEDSVDPKGISRGFLQCGSHLRWPRPQDGAPGTPLVGDNMEAQVSLQAPAE